MQDRIDRMDAQKPSCLLCKRSMRLLHLPQTAAQTESALN